MNQIVTAVYANGVLRPLIPLELPEQTEVEIEIKPVAETNGAAAPLDERERIHQILVEAGLVRERQHPPPPPPPLSAEERERLGRLFAVGKPLSEIIIEEREERFAKTNGATASPINERARLHQILVDGGVVHDDERWQAVPVMPISPEEEEELGRVFAGDKPLSEIIIEEREERF